MLRRNNSKSTLGRRSLGRSRSSNSVGRNPVRDLVSIDPSVAERDAYIAANLSYLKAQIKEKVAQEVAMLPAEAVRATLPRRNSFTSAPDSGSRAHSIHWNHSVAGSPQLRRQQSVRFAGPHAGPRRSLATRASVYTVAPKPTGLTAGCMGTGSIDTENQLPGKDLPHRRSSRKHASVLSDKVTPQANRSFHLGEGDFAPTAPSYRRLRKSKSMYTASLGQSSNISNRHDSDPCSQDRLREWLAAPAHPSRQAVKAAAPELRAPRSMSFLPHSSNSAHRRSAERETDARLSQDNFASHAAPDLSTLLKSKPSSIFRSRSKRPHSSGTLPRTLRNSSDNSAVPSSAWSGDTLNMSKPIGIRTTARKVSRSFKSRIKGLFSRPKSVNHLLDHALLLQDHGRTDSESFVHLDNSTIHAHGASVSAVRSRIPSFHAVPSSQRLKSRQGSFEMIYTEDQPIADEKSRVTSWTTSTVNTVDGHDIGGQENWEDRHIAAIREIGNHASSPAMCLPMRQGNGTTCGFVPLQQPPLIDSQRVYSALVKRLQATSILEKKPPHTLCTDIQPGTPSGENQPRPSLRDESLTTIRCVRADDDVFSDGAKESGSLADVSNSTIIRHSTPSTIRAVRDGANSTIPRKSIQPTVHLDPPKALPTRSSAFFGSPTCHLFRTASPYRRALRESMKASEESSQYAGTDAGYMGSVSELDLPERHPSPEASHKNSHETCAESIYSSNSSPQRTGMPREHEPSFTQDSTDISDATDEHGAATVYVNPSVYKLNIVDAHKRHVSTASSVEWKTWLSAKVSKLETTGSTFETQIPQDDSEVRRPLGHVREQAEIEPDGDAFGEEDKPAVSPSILPLKVVEEPGPGSAQSTPNSKLPSPGEIWRRKSQVLDENTPPNLDRLRDLASKDASPMKPSRAGLRSVPSKSNIDNSSFPCFDARGQHTTELPRMKSLSSLARNSPSREELLQKRRSRTRLRHGGDSAKSSPGLAGAMERQFRNANGGSPGWTRSGRVNGLQAEEQLSEAGSPADGNRQVLSSKRMVDLFLSSRRRRIGSGTRQSSDSFEDAFI